MGLDLGHGQALLALRAAQVTPGHQIPGREKASQAPFLIRPSSSLNTKHQQKTTVKVVFLLERVMGLEPTISAWKANVLPLHYTRKWIRLHKAFFPNQ